MNKVTCGLCLRDFTGLRKELRAARRTNRRMIYKYLIQGWSVSHLTDGHPNLTELLPRCRRVWTRLQSIRRFRKERLLREMRPSDLYALGLTPPLKKVAEVKRYAWDGKTTYPGYTPTDHGNRCRECNYAYGVHPNDLLCPI
jgi:hypothetical protein